MMGNPVPLIIRISTDIKISVSLFRPNPNTHARIKLKKEKRTDQKFPKHIINLIHLSSIAQLTVQSLVMRFQKEKIKQAARM